MTTETMSLSTLNAIRVPSKVVKYWTKLDTEDLMDDRLNSITRVRSHLFCGLDDGRVYRSVKTDEGRVWALHTPSMEGR